MAHSRVVITLLCLACEGTSSLEAPAALPRQLDGVEYALRKLLMGGFPSPWKQATSDAGNARHELAARARGVSTCTDTCSHALNGRCEDGSDLKLMGDSGFAALKSTRGAKLFRQRRSSRKHVELFCDLGTDCTDCGRPVWVGESATLAEAMRGERIHSAEKTEQSEATQSDATSSNVAALRNKGVEVNAAWTATQPSFVMLYTSWLADTDVSASMSSFRAVEPLYNVYWHKLSHACCANGGLVLDVGANFGYYSLYAARMGCRVIAWEPVPLFRHFIEAAARINNLSHMIHVRPLVVSDKSGETVQMLVPERGYWGTASVDGLNVDPSIRSARHELRVTTEALDDVVTEQVPSRDRLA